MQHPTQLFRIRITQNAPKIRDNGSWPYRNRAGKLLKPDFGPVLTQGARKEFEVSDDFEPFVEIEFEILFCCATEETTSPAASATVGYGLAD